MMMGGVFAATEDRFGAAIRTRAPWVGAPGALDMVNFGPRESVPERYRGRTLHEHNPQVTLMRTTAEENDRMGRWIGARLNLMDGPVRFLLPEGGLSQLDAPGQAFHDPAPMRPCSGRWKRRCTRRGPGSSCGCRTTSTTRRSPMRWPRRSRRWRAPARHAPGQEAGRGAGRPAFGAEAMHAVDERGGVHRAA